MLLSPKQHGRTIKYGKKATARRSNIQILPDRTTQFRKGGVFLTNVEIAKISTDMGFEITFTSNEFIISELFKEASDANKLEELNENLLSIFESRLAEYNTIKKLYPKAQKPVSIWIDRCQKTIEKIRNGAN